MLRVLPVFRVGHLAVRIVPLAVLIVSLLLLVALTALGQWLGLRSEQALIFAVLATCLHWLNEIVHNLGHAWAARRTGFPMTGVLLWGLATSEYPPDEGDLPGAVHIRRALGGPVLSTLYGLAAGIIALMLGPQAGVLYWLLLFVAFTNALIFGPAALLPLHIGAFMSDGATILKHLRD